MAYVPGLRSPYSKVGRLVYFGRMLDKIRLQAAGRLPAEYQDNLGSPRPAVFDARCCLFLNIAYPDLLARTRQGGTDEEILAWAEQTGGPRSDDDCAIWNRFMTKLGWRDDRTAVLQQRIIESQLEGRGIETFFDLIECDEGRDPTRNRPWEFRPATIILIMGVAGSGKSTVGRQLAAALGWTFSDADDFHSPGNIAKMSASLPLNDADRTPWLEAIRLHINHCLRDGQNAVVTCSALKEKYREIVIPDNNQVKLVYLKGSREILAQRLGDRTAHFMKPALLDSQLADLEEPRDALVADITEPPDRILSRIRQSLGL